MKRIHRRLFPLLVVLLTVSSLLQLGRPLASIARASPGVSAQQAADALRRLRDATGDKSLISISTATGVVRFVRFGDSAPARFKLPALTAAAAADRSLAFLAEHGAAFGLGDPRAELSLVESAADPEGGWHVTYEQRYGGVPVFASRIKTHFTPHGLLSAINGVAVPELALDVRPAISQRDAARSALRAVSGAGLAAADTRLVVYRTNLTRAIPGQNYLAYVLEVTNGRDVRALVAVDAQSGKVIEQISLMEEALHRRVYNQTYDPGSLIWQENDPFPGTLNQDQQSLVLTAGETHRLFMNIANRDSYDGAGTAMDSIMDSPATVCPNARWNGTATEYCSGVATDDIVAHEWGHAYTEKTSGLIYAWQSGALNESYSDIWGAVVDMLNGRGVDSPDAMRTSATCGLATPEKARVAISAPTSIAGECVAQKADFGPATYDVSAGVVAVNDTVGDTHLACGPIANAAAVAGKIALIDAGACNAPTKVLNAQNAGAVAVLIANNVAPGLPNMGGFNPQITIPAAGVTLPIGAILHASPNAATRLHTPGKDNSYRWLTGEGSTGFGGPIRDLWTPNCFNDPGRVTDGFYHCAETDNGGVHINSGIPNHIFALLVDGGSYNRQTIAAIGLTKAAHIHWRAQLLYLTPSSGFADHADALDQSCADLAGAGTNLRDLGTGAPSGMIITATDCAQVSAAILATELRLSPAACNFQPLLQSNAPAACPPAEGSVYMLNESFDANPGAQWPVSHQDVFAPTNVDWAWDNTLPGDRAGGAMYANGTGFGNCSGAAGDTSRLMEITSPAVQITHESPRLAFDHYIATEQLYDGGNIQINVNGGGWVTIPASSFTFNGYNATMAAAPGNTSPLAGQPGFTGSDGGTVTGSWGKSQVNLAGFAGAGDTIQLRFRFGADGCGGTDGWYIDNVQVYACAELLRLFVPLVRRP